jgi:exodeoxyribonuclease VII large subunit
MLNALNPLTVMERGYSIVYQEGTIINKVESLQTGMDIELQLQDGSAIATINSISREDREEV